jgi:hypothetical protein
MSPWSPSLQNKLNNFSPAEKKEEEKRKKKVRKHEGKIR